MINKTTFEMDGLLSEEDIKNRHSVMFQCRDCKKWTKHIDYLLNKQYRPCACGGVNYDSASIKSLRSYKPLTDNKRKPK